MTAHAPATCLTCAPVLATEAYRRGVARALAARHLTDSEAGERRAPAEDLLAGPVLVPLEELVAR